MRRHLVFEAQDLNVECYMKIAAAIQNVIQLCYVIYDEKERATTQTSLDQFLQEGSVQFSSVVQLCLTL